MALIKRLDKGSPITAVEMDANLQYLEDSISAGTSGVSGTSGSSGTRGTSGSSGTRGAAGSAGSSGSSGTSGAGTSGSSGTSGAGTSGSSGTSGAGTSGSSGTSGISGAGSSAGTSGTSGTSISLSVSDGTTRLSGIRSITLTGLGLNISGSGGAEIINFGGGGGGTSLTVASGSTSVSSVSTLRVDNTMTLANNGAGTVTVGVRGGSGGTGSSGSNGTSGSSGNSVALTINKGAFSIPNIKNITLSGSIFLDVSGSEGAILRVTGDGGAPLVGVITSSQQIVDYNVFAVKNSANSFLGTQNVTGSLISNELYVENSPSFRIPEGSIMIGASGSRSGFLPTSSLGLRGVGIIDQGLNITFNEKTKLAFSDDFVVSASGSDGVVITSVGGGGGSGVGFPFTGSAGISGSLAVTGNASVGGSLTASLFAISSVGVPTIQSATNINLTAGNAVVITSSSLRLSTFTDAQTGSITAQNGDMIYNSTTHKFMGYASGSWVQLH